MHHLLDNVLFTVPCRNVFSYLIARVLKSFNFGSGKTRCLDCPRYYKFLWWSRHCTKGMIEKPNSIFMKQRMEFNQVCNHTVHIKDFRNQFGFLLSFSFWVFVTVRFSVQNRKSNAWNYTVKRWVLTLSHLISFSAKNNNDIY